MQPKTQYAKAGNLNIAYQVVGEGPLDLVFTFGWASHLDFQWTEPTGDWMLFALDDDSGRAERTSARELAPVRPNLNERIARTMARRAPAIARLSARALRR
jgi:hypothetical protein